MDDHPGSELERLNIHILNIYGGSGMWFHLKINSQGQAFENI